MKYFLIYYLTVAAITIIFVAAELILFWNMENSSVSRVKDRINDKTMEKDKTILVMVAMTLLVSVVPFLRIFQIYTAIKDMVAPFNKKLKIYNLRMIAYFLETQGYAITSDESDTRGHIYFRRDVFDEPCIFLLSMPRKDENFRQRAFIFRGDIAEYHTRWSASASEFTAINPTEFRQEFNDEKFLEILFPDNFVKNVDKQYQDTANSALQGAFKV